MVFLNSLSVADDRSVLSSVVFLSFVCLFLLCVWCFFSLVAPAFLANKDVYSRNTTL